MSNWQPGQYRTYRATTKIHLGKYEMDISQDDEFDYDGYSIRYAGMEYAVPQLQGLLGRWFVPAVDLTTTYKARPAGVAVRHATPEARERGDLFQMEEASEEEALVGTLDEQTQIRNAATHGDQNRLDALRRVRAERKASLGILPGEDSNPDAPPPQNAADVDPEIEAALMDDAQSDQERGSQRYAQARPVHTSGSKLSADQHAEVARAERINQARIQKAARELEARDPRKTREELELKWVKDPLSGRTGRSVGRGGQYTVMDEDAGGIPIGKEYKFSEGATVGGRVVEAGAVKTTNVEHMPNNLPTQVGRAVASTPTNREAGALMFDEHEGSFEPQLVRTKTGSTQISREGNVGIDEIGPSGALGDVSEAHTGDDLADLLPDAAVAGLTRARPVPPPPASEDDEIAAIVESWSTRRNWQTRVDEAVSYYGDWPAAIDAICGVESPKVAEQIRSRLARQEGAKT